jgi:hypothetical protein
LLAETYRTRDLPALIVTSKVLAPAEREAIEGLGAGVLSKDLLGRPQAEVEMREGLARVGWAMSPAPATLPQSPAAPRAVERS